MKKNRGYLFSNFGFEEKRGGELNFEISGGGKKGGGKPDFPKIEGGGTNPFPHYGCSLNMETKILRCSWSL